MIVPMRCRQSVDGKQGGDSGASDGEVPKELHGSVVKLCDCDQCPVVKQSGDQPLGAIFGVAVYSGSVLDGHLGYPVTSCLGENRKKPMEVAVEAHITSHFSPHELEAAVEVVDVQVERSTDLAVEQL